MNLNPVGWASSSLRLVARLFNSGVNSSVPVTAISEAPIGVANTDIALVAKGTGATLAQVPDSTATGGNKRGTYATDFQKFRTSAGMVASGARSAIVGGQSNTAGGQDAFIGAGSTNSTSSNNTVICGGSLNVASSTNSCVAGGTSNSATASSCFVGGGTGNTAGLFSEATVCGGSTNVAQGAQSFVGGGKSNTVSGDQGSILGGDSNLASGALSTILGGLRGTSRGISGFMVFPAHAGAINTTTTGASQAGLLVIGKQTTNATATVITSDINAASTTNQVILPNNSAYSFSGEVIAGVTGGGDTACWTINGAIKRGATAASTTMVGTPTVTMTHNDAGAAAWVVAVTADTTNGGIAVTVTGAAATTIRWVCKINTTEMTY